MTFCPSSRSKGTAVPFSVSISSRKRKSCETASVPEKPRKSRVSGPSGVVAVM